MPPLEKPLVSIALILALAACGGSSPEGATGAGDPLKDPEAWRVLPSGERATRAEAIVRSADVKSSETARDVHAFLKARGEDFAAGEVVKKRLAADVNCEWARGVNGQFEVKRRAAQCLRECELAESEDVAECAELRRIVDKGSPFVWVDAATSKKVDDLCAAIRKEDARLGNPYEAAVEKWVRWQRGYPVMRDMPEVHATNGPYLVFVSVGGEKPDRPLPRVMAEKAKSELEATIALLDEVHAVWTRDIAEPLKLVTYGPANATEKTILKVNVFSEENDYFSYQFDADYWSVDFGAAHYMAEEPRFLAAVAAGEVRSGHGAQAMRTEAVRQLVHFHTWDSSRKARERDIDWPLCLNRPLWSADGFPRFFASRVGGVPEQGEPAPARTWLADVFVGRGVAEAKQWKGWTLPEQLAVKDRAELGAAARRRAGAVGENGADALSSLFLGRAASFADFLWNAESEGKPKYRDRYLVYLASEMLAKCRVDHAGREVCVRHGIEDFRKAMGVTDADLPRLESEWNAFEDALIRSEKDPSWDERLVRVLAEAGGPKTKDE